MAVTTWTAGQVLAAQDLNDTLASKADTASPTFTGNVALPGTTTLGGTSLNLPGLVLVATGAATASSTLSINGYATAAFQHYRVVIDATGTANGQTFGVRLRTGGSDATTGYVAGTTFFDPGSTSTSIGRTSSNSQFDLGFITNGTNPNSGYAFDLLRPAVATQTNFIGNTVGQNTGTASLFGICGGWNTNATAYDSLTVISSAAWTGTVRIYGYRN